MEADARTTRGWIQDAENRTAVGWLSIFAVVAGGIVEIARFRLHGFNKRRTLQRKGRFQGRTRKK